MASDPRFRDWADQSVANGCRACLNQVNQHMAEMRARGYKVETFWRVNDDGGLAGLDWFVSFKKEVEL